MEPVKMTNWIEKCRV